MSIFISKKSSLLSVLTLLLVFAIGCTNKENQFDTPEKVATIFWSAIKAGDVEAAKAQVYEPRRKHLGKMITTDILAGNVPSFPSELKFEVQEKDDTAFAVITNSDGVGCDLIKFEGRWWVH